MNTVLQDKDNANSNILYLAFELSAKSWKLGFSNKVKLRQKTIDAGDWNSLLAEIELAKEKLKCTPDCPVFSCYEAGRDGFWIHRALEKENITNYVIDSAAIEVNRRKRQVKSDGVDVKALNRLLIRYCSGDLTAMRPVRVPTVEQEDKRRLQRERGRLIEERGAHSTRIKSLLFLHGIRLANIKDLKTLLPKLKGAVTGYDIPVDTKNELQREYERYVMVDNQVKELEALQKERVTQAQDGSMEKQIEQMMQLKAVGWQTSWYLVAEFFSWRDFKNAKQVGSCAGLTPTPYDSGDSQREQGISKAGNKRVRKVMIEFAWLWLRYQKGSKLSQWFKERFDKGSKRMRRVGIVALARKLLVALWRYLEHGVIPEGAQLTEG
ncbi:IS110 family transposase [Saccharobesus litoralis]|uniref:IS110 family transposase n=1 Tax=Saccharobesus litoralis TaxID=2172099 RepID=A0A2S0VLQ3_9ALTE|nr:IS110 family transposase [Saccharobesus litoralis]AWB65138.1 IS110 family transposase [Saccharobesus litoralis]